MYALADTPVGLAAFFLDHDQRSYRLISRVFAGQAADHAYLPEGPGHHCHAVAEAVRRDQALMDQGLMGQAGRS